LQQQTRDQEKKRRRDKENKRSRDQEIKKRKDQQTRDQQTERSKRQRDKKERSKWGAILKRDISDVVLGCKLSDLVQEIFVVTVSVIDTDGRNVGVESNLSMNLDLFVLPSMTSRTLSVLSVVLNVLRDVQNVCKLSIIVSIEDVAIVLTTRDS